MQSSERLDELVEYLRSVANEEEYSNYFEIPPKDAMELYNYILDLRKQLEKEKQNVMVLEVMRDSFD